MELLRVDVTKRFYFLSFEYKGDKSASVFFLYFIYTRIYIIIASQYSNSTESSGGVVVVTTTPPFSSKVMGLNLVHYYARTLNGNGKHREATGRSENLMCQVH